MVNTVRWLWLVQHLGDSCKVLEEIASGTHPFAKVRTSAAITAATNGKSEVMHMYII